jgi:hypothetical protein
MDQELVWVLVQLLRHEPQKHELHIKLMKGSYNRIDYKREAVTMTIAYGLSSNRQGLLL